MLIPFENYKKTIAEIELLRLLGQSNEITFRCRRLAFKELCEFRKDCNHSFITSELNLTKCTLCGIIKW